MSVTIKQRGDTAANWTAANPILALREMGLELDTQRFKVGNGVTAWNSLGYWGAGTSFPVSPATGQAFFRTDLGWQCHYDGTRWLTAFELFIPVPTATFASTTVLAFGAFRTDYAPYVTRIRTSIFIGVTNDEANYWTTIWRGINATYTGATFIRQETTSADGISQWVQKENAATNATLGTDDSMVDFAVQTTGAPSSIQVVGTLFYKLIVT